MFQTMKDCTDFIFSLKASQFKGEPLEAANKLLASFGHPEQQLPYIHFAGSNGKGSTVNATREILMAQGLTVGAFISPHLVVANERITINKAQISDSDFLRLMNQLHLAVQSELAGNYPSFFEVMTVLAFLYFAEKIPDVVLLETGIGGRIDTTNVITPKVSVITTISLEHTQLLGDTLELVAGEKAGIIKTGQPVVVGVKQVEALNVIKNEAVLKNAPYYQLGNKISITYGESTFTYKGLGRTFKDIALAMEGRHQMDNAGLAITASLLFDNTISEEIIRKALNLANWSGRFERIRSNIILDGAHNLEGTTALVQTLQQVAPDKKYIFLFAVMADKDHKKSIDALSEIAYEVNFTELAMPRAAKAQDLFEECDFKGKNVVLDWQQWLELKVNSLADDELLIVTGSLYFIAEVRHLLLEGPR